MVRWRPLKEFSNRTGCVDRASRIPAATLSFARNPKLAQIHVTTGQTPENHTEEANRRFEQNHFTDDLKFSAWDLSMNWIRPLTEDEHEIYPLPIFHNYVGGITEPGLLGGSPGEDVKTYLENCPFLSFIAVNAYFVPTGMAPHAPAPRRARQTNCAAR